MVSWAEVAPWIVTVVGLGLLAGSLSPRLSVTRWVHRYFVAPLTSVGAIEDATPFLRTDAISGCLALAGSMFVIVGVATIGWVFIGLCTVDLFIDGIANISPMRRVVAIGYSTRHKT